MEEPGQEHRNTYEERQSLQTSSSVPHEHERSIGHGIEIAGTTTKIKSRLRPTRSVRLSDDGHGQAFFGDVEKQSQLGLDGDKEESVEKQFEVQWDGDSDPSNPRGRTQKWLIVLIVSASSLCV